jgi:hypothetical protein
MFIPNLNLNVYVIQINVVCHYVSSCDGMDFKLGKRTVGPIR